MLSESPVAASVPVADMERAKRWYEEKLGLTPSMEMEGGTMYAVGKGTAFFLYATPENAGKAPNTLMAFNVVDLEAEVRDLKAKGVRFEEYDAPDMKTVDSVATIGETKTAWFRDVDGNILALAQM